MPEILLFLFIIVICFNGWAYYMWSSAVYKNIHKKFKNLSPNPPTIEECRAKWALNEKNI